MKKIAILIMFVVISGSLFSQHQGLGLGIRVGEPTGFNAKYWMNDRNAFSFNLGYALSSNSRLHISADYLYHLYDLIDIPENQNSVPFFYGFGVRLVTREIGESSVGARGVVGAAWFLRETPVDIFIEFAPVFRLFPSTGIDFDAAVGARYFFQ